MKKIIGIYILTIIAIACLAFFMNVSWGSFSLIKFPRGLHIILEGTNSLLMFLIFWVGNNLYSKIHDERFAILAGGFLVGSILNSIHIIAMKTFPYDLLSLINIQNNPTMVFLLFGNLILPLSIYFTLIHKPSTLTSQGFRFKVYSTYFLIFLALLFLPPLGHYFFPGLTYEFNVIMHALEFINYSLYIMLAFMVINIRQSSNLTFFPAFTLGLVISGLGGLFYINTSLIQSNEILAHIFQALGLAFMLAGVPLLNAYALYLRFKDELVAYLCLMLIVFYIAFISMAYTLFNVTFPPFSAYIFIEFILIFQFIVYLIANKVTKPITNIIDALSKYKPGEKPVAIPVIRQDEIGLLTEKINATTMLSWEKILETSRIAEKERSIRRIFESMRRVSDQNTIKNTIIDEIKKAFQPDRIFIALYDSVNDSLYFDRYIENLPSKTLLDFKEENEDALITQQFNDLFKKNLEICFSNIEEYIETKSLQNTTQERLLKKYNIKSCCNIPIHYASRLLGYLIIQYTSEHKKLDKEDLAYLKVMATQVGIAIHQAEQ